MAPSKHLRRRRRSQPTQAHQPPATPVAPTSLPLSGAETPLPPSADPTFVACSKCGQKFLTKHDYCSLCGTMHPERAALPKVFRVAEDGKVRMAALKIQEMLGLGLSREEIGKALDLAPSTLRTYMYRAAKSGWLNLDDPRETLEYKLLPKAVQVLADGLDDTNRNEKTGLEVRTQVALKLAEGALYPKQDMPAIQAPSFVGVKVEIVGGVKSEVREGTVMGGQTYIEATPETI